MTDPTVTRSPAGLKGERFVKVQTALTHAARKGIISPETLGRMCVLQEDIRDHLQLEGRGKPFPLSPRYLATLTGRPQRKHQLKVLAAILDAAGDRFSLVDGEGKPLQIEDITGTSAGHRPDISETSPRHLRDVYLDVSRNLAEFLMPRGTEQNRYRREEDKNTHTPPGVSGTTPADAAAGAAQTRSAGAAQVGSEDHSAPPSSPPAPPASEEVLRAEETPVPSASPLPSAPTKRRGGRRASAPGRGSTEAEWLEWLAGKYPDHPPDALRAALAKAFDAVRAQEDRGTRIVHPLSYVQSVVREHLKQRPAETSSSAPGRTKPQAELVYGSPEWKRAQGDIS